MSVTVTEASEESTELLRVDFWRCAQCGGYTYDRSQFEVPLYCCRCGSRFAEMKYRQATEAGEASKGVGA